MRRASQRRFWPANACQCGSDRGRWLRQAWDMLSAEETQCIDANERLTVMAGSTQPSTDVRPAGAGTMDARIKSGHDETGEVQPFECVEH